MIINDMDFTRGPLLRSPSVSAHRSRQALGLHHMQQVHRQQSLVDLVNQNLSLFFRTGGGQLDFVFPSYVYIIAGALRRHLERLPTPQNSFVNRLSGR